MLVYCDISQTTRRLSFDNSRYFFMFKPGQLVTWQIKGTWLEQKKSFFSKMYGYVLHEDENDPGVWHVMMMRKDSDTLHHEEIYEDYLKVVEMKS